MTFYIDGERLDSLSSVVSFNLDGQLNPLVIGNQDTNNDGIIGLVDDLRIFNAPLNLLHAKMLYQPASDEDEDGLSDLDEYRFHTDPNNPDTDSDNLMDGDEIDFHGTDPNNPDTDGDLDPR